LISNKVRIPVFGKKANIIERTPASISKKGYLLMKDSEFYTNPRIMTANGFRNLANHRYVLDTRRQDHSEAIATADGTNEYRTGKEPFVHK
jgi:hypothetical protein